MNNPIDKGEIIIYQPDNESAMLEVRIEDETVWLTQSQMSELFQTTRNNITLHITNIFKEEELEEEAAAAPVEAHKKANKKKDYSHLPSNIFKDAFFTEFLVQ